MAGHTRRPSRSTNASAMPLGGQTSEMLPWMRANASPSLPAAKYAATTSTSSSAERALGDRRIRDTAPRPVIGSARAAHEGRLERLGGLGRTEVEALQLVAAGVGELRHL